VAPGSVVANAGSISEDPRRPPAETLIWLIGFN
jgi:hypothetical protein